MVTVSTGEQSAPKSIFAMSQCTPDSTGSFIIGCMARGFSPADSLTFKWTDYNTKELSDFVQYPAFGSGGEYTKISHMRISKSDWNHTKPYKCEASNPNGKKVSLVAPPKLSLTVESPIQKELFVYDKIVLQAVVSGDVKVQDTSVSCKVKDESVPTENITTGNVEFSTDTSQFKRIHNVTVDTKKWFDGEMVTCTIRDPNNKDIKREISFQKGDGNKPTVTIYKPDNVTDHISHVCEVTSPKLGDVYVIWTVGNEPYREGTTSAPIHQKDSTSVFSILTMTKEEYEKLSTTITCAVIHANMDNRRAPLQVSTSQSKQKEVSCD
ncbi:hypothetical protein cypCar_00046928 [Cyprinus carpio]|nr:hypothetical protein cypCar_00046928 [Cyprinus carpio]